MRRDTQRDPRPASGASSRKEKTPESSIDRYLAWQPIVHGARTPIVSCWRCRASIINETNAMRRAGWQQARWGRGLVFRCGKCAEQVVAYIEGPRP